MTFLIEGAAAFVAMSGAGDYCAVSALGLRVQLLTGNGSLRCSMRDSTAAYLMQNQLSPSGIIQNGVDQTILVSFDLAAQVFRVWVDGVLEMDIALPANSGSLQTVRNIVLGRHDPAADDNSQIIGTWKRMAVWREYTADGSLPVSAPHADIAGDAAAVNAHPWKLGADAV